ncbi:WD-40 repeat-containing protein [Reticulomyxa filosa]|uniref:WD-40 repeat-containing protein n=1 Tax=Reticulomyxa filosa TaxID=46433 RepID=X6MTR7_RETFI|nr:WD-40 repeat-containing protein [Reticulomyxa filosa]|eukprot:ETO16842.1 WD-40 repeat-containing protein [Reticulomyxa filosa]
MCIFKIKRFIMANLYRKIRKTNLFFMAKQDKSLFEYLSSLPPTVRGDTPSVVYKDEILFCGGTAKDCYSYHTSRNEYKFICSYPGDVELCGHCVVKLTDDNNFNGITLLSFGGFVKHTLTMRYISVWDDTIEKPKSDNQWLPFTDKHKKQVFIGVKEDNYGKACALIGGSNNNLLFITYFPKNIAVFDLNTFGYVNRSTLSINDVITEHYFIAKSSDHKKISEMLLFHKNIGLAIEYDEEKNTFQFQKLRECKTIGLAYACVRVNGSVLFFGGDNNFGVGKSTDIYKYSIIENEWMKFENNLPSSLKYCGAILSEDKSFVHVTGSNSHIHVKTKVELWMHEKTERERQWIAIEEEKTLIEQMNAKDQQFKLDMLKKKILEIEIIVRYWNRLASIKIGWLDDFNVIISQYILGHIDYVKNVKFSSDGTKIISTSEDRTVRIWDVMSGNEIQLFDRHQDEVNDAQFSPTGNMVVSCSKDKTIRLWEVKSGREIKKLQGHEASVTSAQFSPDEKNVISSSADNKIILWNVSSGKEIKRLIGHGNKINSVQFSSDCQILVSASDDNNIKIWNVQSGECVCTLKGHSNIVFGAHLSSEGNKIVSCSKDSKVRIWDAKSTKMIKTLFVTDVRGAKFSPDGQTIVSCSSDKIIRLWDIEFGMITQTLEGHLNNVTGIDFSPDGNTIASCSIDKTIRLWGSL